MRQEENEAAYMVAHWGRVIAEMVLWFGVK